MYCQKESWGHNGACRDSWLVATYRGGPGRPLAVFPTQDFPGWGSVSSEQLVLEYSA